MKRYQGFSNHSKAQSLKLYVRPQSLGANYSNMQTYYLQQKIPKHANFNNIVGQYGNSSFCSYL